MRQIMRQNLPEGNREGVQTAAPRGNPAVCLSDGGQAYGDAAAGENGATYGAVVTERTDPVKALKR